MLIQIVIYKSILYLSCLDLLLLGLFYYFFLMASLNFMLIIDIHILYITELCLKNLNDLSSVGLIEMDEDVNFKPTGKNTKLF